MKLMFKNVGGFVEFEREVIKERMLIGRIEKAKLGKFAAGSVPYDYDLVSGQLVVNEQQALVVRDVF